ncbi:hypothetical protein B0H15DRAFT_520305 [Mycena belliarum]|uniref:Uncharacterized protein n=1 Tax=Mycena belliarum TaxID=1033014 RepID=A0AAD6TVH4_9AGAR|nr:hypothetical protein B0H15DRAFT_520305 [Mycena belliae]
MRILTPRTSCRRFFWLFSLATTLFTILSNYVLAIRVYTMWDGRRAIKWLLTWTFGAALPVSVVFGVLASQETQSSVQYDPLIRMCVLAKKPKLLPVVLGVWVAFDIFMLFLTIYNALEKPRQSQAEMMTTLQHDGAKMFLCLLVLRLANFIVAIVGDAANCFVTFTVLWTMCSVVTSRMQLRVERLRFSDIQPSDFLYLQ